MVFLGISISISMFMSVCLCVVFICQVYGHRAVNYHSQPQQITRWALSLSLSSSSLLSHVVFYKEENEKNITEQAQVSKHDHGT